MKDTYIKAIEEWVQRNEKLDVDALQRNHSDYVKFWVQPWSNLRMDDSAVMPLDGAYKAAMVYGLIHIYTAWQEALEKCGEPYYLKIWLFENDVARSQVVCAIRDRLHFYDGTFEPNATGNFCSDSDYAGIVGVSSFEWMPCFALHVYCSDDLGEVSDFESEAAYQAHKDWFESQQRNAISTSIIGGKECFTIRKDVVWVGGKG